MKNILTIMKNCHRRNRIVIFICIALGVLLGVEQKTLGTNFNADFSQIKIVLITQEDNAFTKHLTDYFTNQLGMDIQLGKDFDEYTNTLLNRDISAIIELKPGYYNQCIQEMRALPIETTTIENYQNEAYLKAYLDNYLESMDVIFQSAGKDEAVADQLIKNLKVPELTVVGADASLHERSCNNEGFTLTVGFYMNFVWILGMFLGLTVVSDRIDGTFLRIQGTPIKGYQYMIGTELYYFVVGLLVPILFLSILKLKDVTFGFSYWLAAGLIILIQTITIGISMLLSLFVKSKIGIVVTIYSVGALLAIMGGAYFDISGIHGSLEKLIKITPTYWFMNCIREMQNTIDFSPVTNILVLSLFAILFLLLSSTLFTRQMEAKE